MVRSQKAWVGCDGGCPPVLTLTGAYCWVARPTTGFWTPKAVMKMLTTTIMKTRPVARLLRKSSLACLAGLLRSYLTVGKRVLTLPRPPARPSVAEHQGHLHPSETRLLHALLSRGLAGRKPRGAWCLRSHGQHLSECPVRGSPKSLTFT